MGTYICVGWRRLTRELKYNVCTYNDDDDDYDGAPWSGIICWIGVVCFIWGSDWAFLGGFSGKSCARAHDADTCAQLQRWTRACAGLIVRGLSIGKMDYGYRNSGMT